MLNLLMIILHAARDGPLTRNRNPVARQGEPLNGAERTRIREKGAARNRTTPPRNQTPASAAG